MANLINIILFLLYFNFIFSEVLFLDNDYWFSFTTVSLDYSNDSVIDLSYLNWKIEEKIIVKNGHFYYKDKQVRFFGVNVAYESAFPLKENAPKIAKRMAQLGINLVRFHHMDNLDIWGTSYSEIRQNNRKSNISETQLDKLHYFLYYLKQNGIYTNLNMHVSRDYPEIMDELVIRSHFNFGKALDRYYPLFINYQLQYAKDILTSYNKYTRFKLGNDPMILNIELNNENTMYYLEDEEKVNSLNDELKNELIK